jgi:hypothetical protein
VKNFQILRPTTGMLVERRFKSKDFPRNSQVAGVIIHVSLRSGGITLVLVQWPDQSREHIAAEYLRRMI